MHLTINVYKWEIFNSKHSFCRINEKSLSETTKDLFLFRVEINSEIVYESDFIELMLNVFKSTPKTMYL